jgi:uncharacterized membrane protein
MRKRLVRALIFLVIAIGTAVGAATAAGAFDGEPAVSHINDGVVWD